jgi:hypothetical protein
MIQAQPRAYGLGTPSPLDLWIDAMLRVFAELVRHVAQFLGMPSRRPRECHAAAMPVRLPRANGNTFKETESAEENSASIEGLILRTVAQSAFVDSKDEAVLTAAATTPQAARVTPLPRSGEGNRARFGN